MDNKVRVFIDQPPRSPAPGLAVPCLHHPGGIVRGKLFGKCCYFCSSCERWFSSAEDLASERALAYSTNNPRSHYGCIQRNR